MNFRNCIKDQRCIYAALGVAAVVVGKKILTAKKTRELTVSALAKGMKLQSDAAEIFTNMKEEATDICYDAKVEAQLNKVEEASDIEE